ncbi:MAG: RNA polymerase sigma factor [Ectothiorhodospiraceae bacterium]|nr:RNA polymerase sigma factor [Ectothiorhodospiraceae bacterium]
MTRGRDSRATLDAVWRLESGRIIGTVLRLVGDLAQAEELAQDALLAALEKWTEDGVPENPAGWLMTTARNRAIDLLRRQSMYQGIRQQLLHESPVQTAADLVESAAEERIDDDVLRLMFGVCHPLLPADARVALALRLVNGLSVAEIARAYLLPEATIAQRITRAKRTLKAARVGFDLPPSEARAERLGSVLEAIYLIFNEGYAATAGERWFRPMLCEEALRLGRSLASLVSDDTEVLGLAALLEFQSSRLTARCDAAGQPILLAMQDRGLWDRLLIRRGFEYLNRAFALQAPVGVYCLQAAIAACHARSPSLEQTDWEEILALYDGLLQAQPTAVVALNRAMAVSMVDGPEAALALVDSLRESGELYGYHLLYSVRGDLLQKLGRLDEARVDFLRAAELTDNRQAAELMRRRATECVARERGTGRVPH